MTASSATLPAFSGGYGLDPGASVNVQLNQSDKLSLAGFDQVLVQAYGTVPGTAAAESAPATADQDLLKQLQALPQDGNLLPLLQQVFDAAAAAGSDPRKLLEDIVARLQGAGSDTGRVAADRIQQLLQQLVTGGAEQASVVTVDMAALGATYRDMPAAQSGAPATPGRRPPQLLEQLRLAAGAAGERGKLPAEGGREQQALGAAKFLEPVYQPAAEAGHRSTEMLALLAASAALRRGQQDVEYLALLARTWGGERTHLATMAREILGLQTESVADEDPKEWLERLLKIDPQTLWSLRFRVGLTLDGLEPPKAGGAKR
mgnify:CR=1 FL=1